MARIKKPSGLKRVQRRVQHRQIKTHYLVVCEGSKTEPNYFNCFPQPSVEVGSIVVKGMGANTDSLVGATRQLKAELERKQRYTFTHVWCVFDRDSFPAQNFNRALQLAKQYDFHVACSNNAFEIWYLLHFDYHDTAISRHSYGDKLSEPSRLGFAYKKNSGNMYDLLFTKQAVAIKNAKRLYLSYGKKPSLEQCDPITLVYKLVQDLNNLVSKN